MNHMIVERDLLGFTVQVWTEPDIYADLDHLGTYSRRPKNDYSIPTGRGGRYFEYFNPPIANYLGLEEEEIRKYCQQDFEFMENFQKTWNMIVFHAEIFYKGISLGIASIYGVEDIWGQDNPWHTEATENVLFEAFGEARKKLEILKEII